MKTLKRLKLNQLDEIQSISAEEMMQFMGGKGCCWEVLAKLYQQMYPSEYNNPKIREKWNVFSASTFEEGWRTYMGEECAENGDPMNYQASDLFEYMQQCLPGFRTTTSGFETGDISRMLTASGANNYGNQGLVFGLYKDPTDPTGKDLHAVMIDDVVTDTNTGAVVGYSCWNPDTGKHFTATPSSFKGATGVYRDDNKE